MNKAKTKKQKTKTAIELPVVNPYSAGIDTGDTLHVVAVAEGLSTERVRSFGTMTSDLTAIADWLAECEIDTIAMKSTGVYWKPLFNLLNSKGFEGQQICDYSYGCENCQDILQNGNTKGSIQTD